MTFKELRGKRSSCHHRVSKNKKRKYKAQKTLVGRGPQLFADFYFLREVLEPIPREKRGMSVW
jgi:hypothetical protein